jgi:hypothetical protein
MAIQLALFRVGGHSTAKAGSGSSDVLQDLPSPGSIQAVRPSFTGNPQGGTSAPFSIVQPTIISNKLLRII